VVQFETRGWRRALAIGSKLRVLALGESKRDLSRSGHCPNCVLKQVLARTATFRSTLSALAAIDDSIALQAVDRVTSYVHLIAEADVTDHGMPIQQSTVMLPSISLPPILLPPIFHEPSTETSHQHRLRPLPRSMRLHFYFCAGLG